jgi:hypothetical protein
MRERCFALQENLHAPSGRGGEAKGAGGARARCGGEKTYRACPSFSRPSSRSSTGGNGAWGKVELVGRTRGRGRGFGPLDRARQALRRAQQGAARRARARSDRDPRSQSPLRAPLRHPAALRAYRQHAPWKGGVVEGASASGDRAKARNGELLQKVRWRSRGKTVGWF